MACIVASDADAVAVSSEYVVRISVNEEGRVREVSGVAIAGNRVITSRDALLTDDAADLSVTGDAGVNLRVQSVLSSGGLAILAVESLPVNAPLVISAAPAQVQDEATFAWWGNEGVAANDLTISGIAPLHYQGSLAGRALGGGIFNTCGQLIGVIAPSANEGIVRRATGAGQVSQLPTEGVSKEAVEAALTAANIAPNIASAPCAPTPESPVDEAVAEAPPEVLAARVQEAQTEVERLERELATSRRQDAARRAALQRELDEATRVLGEAQQASEAAVQRARGAEEQAASAQGETRQLTQYTRYGAAGAALLIAIIGAIAAFLLIRARRRSDDLERNLDKRNRQDRARETAADWVLVGAKGRLKLRGALLADEARGSVVGRGQADADVLIDAEQISRKHARFFYRSDTLMVEDMRSLNGTSVNGRRLNPGDIVEVREGDKIDFASLSYVLRRT